MNPQNQLDADVLAWLLEEASPGVCYLALRDLVNRAADDEELISAREKAHTDGPIAAILAQMDDEGFWKEAGPGYLPKYYSTVWAIIMLWQLGAAGEVDGRIHRACDYILDHALAAGGLFSAGGTPGTNVDCLQGNLCGALLELGCKDSRLEQAFEWMARSVTGEGVAPNTERKAAVRYYSGNCGPGFACGANNKLPCAWGAVKVMLAFSKLPLEMHTPLIDRAIAQGVEFLFSVDPATAEYPSGWAAKPSGNWWKFGFPVFYVTDLLQNVEALVGLGYGDDPRLANGLRMIRAKQDGRGRWALEYSYTGKTWVDFGPKKQANKWVTLRALRVLKNVSG